MVGILKDHRTQTDKAQTWGFVCALDQFMSGWGQAPGKSYFMIPVKDHHQAQRVKTNMKNRSDMNHVRVVGRKYRPQMRKRRSLFNKKYG